MTRVEIETIVEAMEVKQTWIRKELQNFLDVWADITNYKISGYDLLEIDRERIYNDNGEYVDAQISTYLERSNSDIYSRKFFNNGSSGGESTIDINSISINRIKFFVNQISILLVPYFKKIQNDIGSIDESGRNIKLIIEKLK